MSGRAGHTPGSNRVSFTKASADRIAAVVRTVEQGNRDATPFVGSPRMQGGGKPVKKGEFNGDWDIGDMQTVTVCSTTLTMNVMNLTMHYWGGDGTATATVLFTKTCGTNTAIEIEKDQCRNIGGAINKIASFDSTKIQILGQDSGCLKWFDIFTCATATT